MKKIIYSLVIMIAAGSLFTSCIEPVEPAGIFDLREAKARYYDALSKLRAADAVRVEADAELVKAQAEHERQIADNVAAQTETIRLQNEALAQGNEVAAAKWALELEKLQKEREILRITWEQQLAEAQEALRQALSKIEMAGLDLTDAEKKALDDAIARYEKAYQDWIDAKEAVLAAEANVWEAEYDFEVADWAAYYQSGIDYYTAFAEYVAALYEELANNSDLADWAAELESLKEELTQVKYDRYKVTKDSVEYMMNVYHDGVHAYEMAVADWVAEHPAVANPGKAPKDKDASAFYADTITFPTLKVTTPNQAYDKLVSLLSSYGIINSPVSGADPANPVIFNDGGKLTIVANQDMKDFILGTATSTDLEYSWKDADGNKQTIEAQYGLNGAVSTLKRVLVLDKKAGKSQEELEKDAEDALKLWQADRDSIIALYDAKAAKKNIANAYEPLKEALAALTAAKNNAASESGSLVKAAETLIEKINGMITHSDMSTEDSIGLVNAFVDFAKARAAYLDYTPYKNNVQYDNKDMFYYAFALTPDVLVDSIAFSDLTINLVRNTKGFAYDTDGNPVGADPVQAYVNIANQLLGTAFGTAINGPWPKSKIADATILNNDGFYGEYKYVAGDPAKIQTAAGEDYTPKEVSDAIEDVKAATTELNNLWNRFWAEDLGATCDADGKVTIPALDDKYNPKTYELKSFTDPYNVVIFDGANILWTANLGAILGSVDPNKSANDGSNFDAAGIVSGAAIFAGANGTTDFYKYLYAANLADNNDTSEEIEKIEKWVADVVAAFEKDVTDAEAAAKKANEKAASDYEKAKAKYDEYAEARKAFTGVDAKGNFLPIVATIGTPDANYEAAGVKQEETGVYEWTGKWDLDGEQAKLAEQYLPKYPELLAEWHTTAVQTDHKIIHLEEIIDKLEDAYIAAVGILYDEEDYIAYYGFNVEEYFEDFLGFYEDYYEYCLQRVAAYEKALAMFNAGYDPNQINLVLVNDELEIAQLKLKDAEAKLAAAEAYYNAVLAKILGNN